MKKLFCILILINFSIILFSQETVNSYTIDELSNQLKINNSELKILNQEYQQSLIDVKNAKAGL